jgi:hypothetical protein
MKFKIKALVAAVALAAFAGQAAADVRPGNSNTSSPNGELVFFAYTVDGSGNVASYIKDLGVTTDVFAATPAYANVSLTGDGNWTSFTGVATSQKFWGVFGTQKLSASTTAANATSLFTTFAGNDASGVSALFNNQYGLAFSNANNAIGALNAGGTNYPANTSAFFGFAPVDNGSASGNFGAYLNSDFATLGVFPNSVNPFSTDRAQFYDVSRGLGTAAAGIPTVADVNSLKNWHFDGSSLEYVAAVPEPETYGMLLAGLMMVGAIARRRRSA